MVEWLSKLISFPKIKCCSNTAVAVRHYSASLIHTNVYLPFESSNAGRIGTLTPGNHPEPWHVSTACACARTRSIQLLVDSWRLVGIVTGTGSWLAAGGW